MSRFLAVLALLLGATLMTVPAPSPAAQPGKNAEDTRLANAFQTYLDEEFPLHPLFATQQGNHEFDDQLDDLSPAARAKDVTRAKAWLATSTSQPLIPRTR